MFQTWNENTFQSFKKNPISFNVFEDIQKLFEEFLISNDFNKIFGKVNESTEGTYCGVSFKKDQLLYHCNDCALDETCVLCEKCFNFEAHQDHEYWYSIGTNSSGSCDCGEDDSWKNDLKCPHHQSEKLIEENESINANIEGQKVIAEDILNYTIRSFCNYVEITKSIDISEECVLILYNDESHSFDDVIEVLGSELGIDVDTAQEYAKLIDIKGFAPILLSPLNTCNRLSRKFKTLTTSVESVDICYSMILASECISYLGSKVGASVYFRKLIVDWYLNEFKNSLALIGDTKTNNLGVLFILDHLLWKSVRLCLNEILNLCNAIDQESKKLIAETYCKHYNLIFEFFLKEKREAHLSVTNFSVQIFTLSPVAEHCLQETNILLDLFTKMIEILEPGYHIDEGMKFESIRLFNFRKFSVLTHDALNITRNVRCDKLQVPNLSKALDTFIYLLFLLTHMEGHLIKTGDHVTYDRDNYDNANYICYEVQKISQELVKIIVRNCELEMIWNLLEKYIDQSPHYNKIFQNEKDNQIPLYKSKRTGSFFGSLSWFFSSLVREAMQFKKVAMDLKIPSKIVKCFAIDSLQRILFSAEVRSGLWVRNGIITIHQEFFYSNTVLHHLTYFSDLFNCIIGGHLMDKIPFIEMIIKYSFIIDYIHNLEETGPIVEQFMVIFLNCCSSKLPDLDLDQILIDSLCTEGLTKSGLVKVLPEVVVESNEFRHKLIKMVKLNTVQSIGVDAKLEIIKQFMDKFDPFYWALTMNQRLKAWNCFKGKRQDHLDLFYNLFLEKYPISAEITKEADFLFEMLSIFVDSSGSGDSEFALEMLLILLKSITSLIKDQDCLDRFSTYIKKFHNKKNISKVILDFMSTICPSKFQESDVIMQNDESLIARKNIKDNRLKIMDSFKRQRDVFISEPRAILEDTDECCCVVCSESNTSDVDDFLGIPVQINQSSLLKFKNSIMGSFVKGCYHLVHSKCFSSLPKVGNFKKCTLCDNAIDLIIPQIDDSNINTNFALNVNYEQENVSDTLNRLNYNCPVNDNYNDTAEKGKLFTPFCCTIILHVINSESSSDSLPVPQILTLTHIKRNLLKDKELIENSCIFPAIRDLFLNSNSNNNNNTNQSEDKIIVFEIVIFSILLVWSGKLNLGDLFNIISRLVERQNNDPKFIKILNLIINCLNSETFCKSSSSTFKFCKSIGNESIDIDNQENYEFLKVNFDLISLPYRHDLFLRKYLHLKCKKCETIPKSGAVCLLCGTLVCVGQGCCRNSILPRGECYSHRQDCSGNVGIFFLIRSCALLLISESIGTIVPAPYVNSFGEHDFDLSSSSALFLNSQLYTGKLNEMWKNNELRDFILRNMDNSRVHASSWSML